MQEKCMNLISTHNNVVKKINYITSTQTTKKFQENENERKDSEKQCRIQDKKKKTYDINRHEDKERR